jgi:four helix bundle protein
MVWQKSMSLVKDVYQHTCQFPKEELYGLASQMRRAAVSVPSNIAEGQGRLSKREFKQFLGVARGSLLELETQLIIAGELRLLSEDGVDELLVRTGEVLLMLNGLMKSMC